MLQNFPEPLLPEELKTIILWEYQDHKWHIEIIEKEEAVY
jgi:hypothetical protein